MVAETKLYDALSVSPTASQADIKRAYRKAALKHHPDKNKDDPKASERFKEVSQAYEILSDEAKRKTYDQYGLDFMLRGGGAQPDPSDFGSGSEAGSGFGGMPGGGFPGFGGVPGGGGRTYTFNMGGGGPGGAGRGPFSFSSADDIFSQFMRGGGAGGPLSGDDDLDDIFSGFGGMPGGFGGANGGARPRGARGGMRARSPETTVVEKPMPVTLEDIFTGVTKKLKIGRKTYDAATGKQRKEEKILEVPIKKGLKAGSKIKFANVGDQIEGGTQDIHFIVSEKPHERFTREGDDLRTTVDVSLKEALTGWQRSVTTIDGRKLGVSAASPTPPEWTERFPGLGMPKSKTPDQRGDLLVGVRIKFPDALTAEQKQALAAALP